MKILLLPGDGIGPEIARATHHVLERLSSVFRLDLSIETGPIGLDALPTWGTTLPDAVRAKAQLVDGIILAPLSTYAYPPPDRGGVNASAEFRTGLDLYANIRPCVTRIPTRHPAADLVVVRENTEGFYASRAMHQGAGEFMPDPHSAFALRKITAHASMRIAREAFALARARRRKVTAVHKANVLKLSDGLFLESVRAIARENPDVELEEMLVDAVAAVLVRDPARFDVLVTTNMFGDILSNQAAEIAGGLGLAPSLNAGDDAAMAQAAHGSAPDIAGRDIANPTGLVLSAAMLLDWLGRRRDQHVLCEAAARLEAAVAETLSNPRTRTPDIGGTLGTSAVASAIAAAI